MTSAIHGFTLVNVSGIWLASCIWDLKFPNLFQCPDTLFIVSPHTCTHVQPHPSKNEAAGTSEDFLVAKIYSPETKQGQYWYLNVTMTTTDNPLVWGTFSVQNHNQSRRSISCSIHLPSMLSIPWLSKSPRENEKVTHNRPSLTSGEPAYVIDRSRLCSQESLKATVS